MHDIIKWIYWGLTFQWANVSKFHHVEKHKCQFLYISEFSSVQSLGHVWLFVTPWTAARQDFLSITNSQSLLRLMPIKSVMPSSHLILYRPLFLLPSMFPNIRVFSNESVLCIRWPNYWSFSFNINPSNECSGLIFSKIDWFDPLASPRDSQESSPTPQFKSINFRCWAFFIFLNSILVNTCSIVQLPIHQLIDICFYLLAIMDMNIITQVSVWVSVCRSLVYLLSSIVDTPYNN